MSSIARYDRSSLRAVLLGLLIAAALAGNAVASQTLQKPSTPEPAAPQTHGASGYVGADTCNTYTDIFSQLIECWSYGAGIAPPVAPGTLPPGAITTPCPVPVDLQGSDLTAFGGPATYSTQTQFVYSDVRWKPVKRLTVVAGYAGSFANGNTLFLNPNAPVGPPVYVVREALCGIYVRSETRSRLQNTAPTTATTLDRFRVPRGWPRSGVRISTRIT